MKTLFSVFVVSVFLLITACQSAAVPEGNQDRTDSNPVVPSETAKPMQIIPQTSPPDSESGNEGVTMPDLTIPSDPNAQRLAQIAKEDLAQKFKVSIDQIQITAIEAMVWPDSSLGCPQMGSMYTQVLTPGFKISLETNGKPYTYHTDDQDRVLLCRSLPGREIFLTPSS
jgi:hypothetical protein